jgi:hypothetical protein
MWGQEAWHNTDGTAGRDFVGKLYKAQGAEQMEHLNGNLVEKIGCARCFVLQ